MVVGALRHYRDASEAAAIARLAGMELVRVRSARQAQDAGPDLGALGDSISQSVISDELAQRFPGDAVLSEEAPLDDSGLGANRVWIVDPLDGTREYAAGRSDWAVHVALWERGAIRAGAVALPAADTVSSSADPPVAVATAAGLHASRLDGSPLQYNVPDPQLPDLPLSRRELARVLAVAAHNTDFGEGAP